MSDMFETDLQFLKISSMLIFISKGLTKADLKLCENLTFCSHVSVTVVITGNIRSVFSLRSDVGMGCNSQIFVTDLHMNLHTSISCGDLNELSLYEVTLSSSIYTGSMDLSSLGLRFSLILHTLSQKKSLKSLATVSGDV